MDKFDRFRKWLAEAIYPVNPTDLARIEFGPPLSKLEFDVDALSKAEREELYSFAETTWSNPLFSKLGNHLRFTQLEHIGYEAAMGEQTLIARGSLNGIELFMEEFERLSLLFRASRKVEKFNEFDVI